MNAILKSARSSNQVALHNFRYTPLAGIATLVVPAVASEEEIARRRAEEDARKAAKAGAKAAVKAAKAARVQPLPQVRMVTPATPETLEALERQRKAKALRSEEHMRYVARTAPIPEEVLKNGLEADKAEEAARALSATNEAERFQEILKKGLEADRAEEAARAEAAANEVRLRKEGFKLDVHKSAMSVLFNPAMNLEGMILAIEELGFVYFHDHNNSRDAFYYHHKSGAEVRVNGGAIGASSTKREHKPRGVELLTARSAGTTELSPEVVAKQAEARANRRREHEELLAKQKEANIKRAAEQLQKKQEPQKKLAASKGPSKAELKKAKKAEDDKKKGGR